LPKLRTGGKRKWVNLCSFTTLIYIFVLSGHLQAPTRLSSNVTRSTSFIYLLTLAFSVTSILGHFRCLLNSFSQYHQLLNLLDLPCWKTWCIFFAIFDIAVFVYYYYYYYYYYYLSTVLMLIYNELLFFSVFVFLSRLVLQLSFYT